MYAIFRFHFVFILRKTSICLQNLVSIYHLDIILNFEKFERTFKTLDKLNLDRTTPFIRKTTYLAYTSHIHSE